jgi:hypothetical protein
VARARLINGGVMLSPSTSLRPASAKHLWLFQVRESIQKRSEIHRFAQNDSYEAAAHKPNEKRQSQ